MSADSAHGPPRLKFISPELPSAPAPAPPSEQAQITAALKEHWRKVGYEFSVKSIERLEGAAKQLIALNGTLQGLYLAVFAFSDLRDYSYSPLVWLFLVPMVLSVLSMLSAARVYIPREYEGADSDDVSPDAWQRFSQVYNTAVMRKRVRLYWSHRLLIGSFVVLILCLGVALGYPPVKSAPAPTQILIVTPSPAPIPTATPR